MDRRSVLLLALGAAGRPRGGKKSVIDKPVLVVSSLNDVARALRSHHIAYDEICVPSPTEASRPRADLERFLATEAKRSRALKAEYLLQILALKDGYTWYCSGFEFKGWRYLYCTFVLSNATNVVLVDSDPDHLGPAHFPEIDDGGTAVSWCTFSCRTSQILDFGWNGEA